MKILPLILFCVCIYIDGVYGSCPSWLSTATIITSDSLVEPRVILGPQPWSFYTEKLGSYHVDQQYVSFSVLPPDNEAFVTSYDIPLPQSSTGGFVVNATFGHVNLQQATSESFSKCFERSATILKMYGLTVDASEEWMLMMSFGICRRSAGLFGFFTYESPTGWLANETVLVPLPSDTDYHTLAFSYDINKHLGVCIDDADGSMYTLLFDIYHISCN